MDYCSPLTADILFDVAGQDATIDFESVGHGQELRGVGGAARSGTLFLTPAVVAVAREMEGRPGFILPGLTRVAVSTEVDCGVDLGGGFIEGCRPESWGRPGRVHRDEAPAGRRGGVMP